MNPRAKHAAVIFAVVACFTVVLLVTHREPRKNGHTLSQWLTIFRASDTTADQREVAAKAIREIGVDGLPLLLRRATDTESPLAARLRAFLIRSGTSLAPTRLHKWAHTPLDQTRANEAKLGFVILGSQAGPAIPALTKLARERQRTDAGAWASKALSDIGPSALPSLITIIDDVNAACREDAIRELENMGTNAAVALPAVIRALNAADPELARTGVNTIGNLRLCPEISVPALCKCLEKPDTWTRIAALQSISSFGSEAQASLPLLRRMEAVEKDPVVKEYFKQVALGLEGKAPKSLIIQ